MAIIYSYPYDQTITDTDAWVGTDSVNRQTKQYTAKAVADYLNINGRIAIAGQMNYQFVEDPSFKGGTFAFPGGQGDNTPWSSITSIVISNMDLSGQIVSPFLEYLIDEQVMFQDVADKASFGHYIMRGYAQIGTTNFYTLTLEYIGGNGSTSLDSYYTLVNFYLESAATHDVTSIDTSDTQFISMTPTSPTTGDVTITASLSATGTPDNTKFLRGDNTWAVADLGFWELGTAPDSMFTTKMASVGQDANIANSKFNVYKTEDMISSVPHIATFNESSSNHSANLWPSPGDNAADIYGSVSRATLTGSGTVDQIIGANPIGRHSGSGSVNFIQGVQTTANLIGSGSANTVVASYAKAFIAGTSSTNIPSAMGAWNAVALNGLNDVDTIYGTYSNVVLTKGDVNDNAIGHFIDFDQVAVDTEVNNAYYIHAKNDSLSVTGEKFFIKDETGIPSQFSNKLVLNAYGSGTFTGAATQRLAVDTNGNVIEIPIGSGPVDGSGTANYSARWIDTDTLGIGALYDNGTNVGIGTTTPSAKLDIEGDFESEYALKFTNTKGTGTVSGFRSHGVNGEDLSLYNGSNRIQRWDENGNSVFDGNVGIGTTSPGGNLHVVGNAGSSGQIYLSDRDNGTGTGDALLINKSGTNAFIYNRDSGDLRLGSNDQSSMVSIKSTGNVGIGTTAPSQKLHISGNMRLTGAFRDRLNSQGAANYVLTSTGSNGTQWVDASGSSIIGGPYLPLTGGALSGNLAIIKSQPTLTLVDGVTVSYLQNINGSLYYSAWLGDNIFQSNSGQTMVIKQNGNVGIGTTSPAVKLHVNDSVGGILRLSDTSATADGEKIGGIETGVADGTFFSGINFFRHDGNDGEIRFRTKVNNINTDVMTIVDGNVGIGTTSPGQKLDVSGNIASNSIYLYDSTSNDRLVLDLDGSDNLQISTGTSTGSRGITFLTESSEKMRILSGGNVGIGTTSPVTKLHLYDNTATVGLSIQADNASNSDINLGDEDDINIGRIQYSHSTDSMQFQTNNAERIRINNAGNVGIGTTSPGVKLDVNGQIRSNNEFLLQTGTTAIGSIRNQAGALDIRGDSSRDVSLGSVSNPQSLFVEGTNGNVGIGTTSPSQKLEVAGVIPKIYVNSSNNTGGSIIFDDNLSTGTEIQGTQGNVIFKQSGSEKMRIASTGRVGIGTTNPDSLLHVSADVTGANTGTITIEGRPTGFLGDDIATIDFHNNGSKRANIRMERGNTANDSQLVFSTSDVGTLNDALIINEVGNVGIGTTSPSRPLSVYRSTAGSAANFLHYTDATAFAGLYIDVDNVNNIVELNASGDTASTMAFQTGNAERMRITTTGNVGIGTTNPNAKLNVNGNIKIEGTNALLFGGSPSVPSWEIKHDGSDLIINDTGTNVGSVLFNNDEGIVLPRLTTTEINAISLPSTGLTVYNTTLNTLCFYNGSSWQKVSHANM